jgi:hypothetical protein
MIPTAARAVVFTWKEAPWLFGFGIEISESGLQSAETYDRALSYDSKLSLWQDRTFLQTEVCAPQMVLLCAKAFLPVKPFWSHC